MTAGEIFVLNLAGLSALHVSAVRLLPLRSAAGWPYPRSLCHTYPTPQSFGLLPHACSSSKATSHHTFSPHRHPPAAPAPAFPPSPADQTLPLHHPAAPHPPARRIRLHHLRCAACTDWALPLPPRCRRRRRPNPRSLGQCPAPLQPPASCPAVAADPVPLPPFPPPPPFLPPRPVIPAGKVVHSTPYNNKTLTGVVSNTKAALAKGFAVFPAGTPRRQQWERTHNYAAVPASAPCLFDPPAAIPLTHAPARHPATPRLAPPHPPPHLTAPQASCTSPRTTPALPLS